MYLTKHLTWNEREDLGALGENVYVSMSRGDSLGTKAQSHICAPFPGKKRGQPKLRDEIRDYISPEEEPKTGMRRKIRLKLRVPDRWSSPMTSLTNHRHVNNMYAYEQYDAIYDAMKMLLTKTAHSDGASHTGSVCPIMLDI